LTIFSITQLYKLVSDQLQGSKQRSDDTQVLSWISCSCIFWHIFVSVCSCIFLAHFCIISLHHFEVQTSEICSHQALQQYAHLCIHMFVACTAAAHSASDVAAAPNNPGAPADAASG
jgi:hypothetical protein